jgi:hypothetical protein
LDGSLLAGIVAGVVADENDIIQPDALIPIAQPYTNLSIEDANDSGSGSGTDNGNPYFEPSSGDLVGSQSANTTYLDSMDVDLDSLRATANPLDFDVTFGPTFTKTTKGFGGATNIVKFQFKEKARNGFFRKQKIFDPDQTMDSPLKLLVKDGNNLEIAGGNGNFISPIDGELFITKNGDVGNTKPLTAVFEKPIRDETGEDTGDIETITRTYDDIPSMAIMDEEFNLYFIEPDGIEFKNGNVDSIKAKMINNIAANKLKFSREDQEISVDDGGTPSDPSDDEYEEIQVYDFPQMFFVDMRVAGPDIIQACSALDPATFLIDDNDSDEITEIVEESDDCLRTYRDGVQGLVDGVRTSLAIGEVPNPISVDAFETLNTEVRECLGGIVDDICRFVVNTLNTSFKVLEDEDETPLDEFYDGSIDEDLLEGFEEIGPTFTGAREYAAGIGDSAQIGLGEIANISLIPRDSYDKEILADLTDKIVIEIVSDTGGNARFIRNDDDSILTRAGNEYTAQLVSNRESVVRLRARICGRTIQAVTLDGLESDILDEVVAEVDCIPDSADEAAGGSAAAGSLARVDRILTVFFIRKASVALAETDASGELAHSNPQEFGTGLEN